MPERAPWRGAVAVVLGVVGFVWVTAALAYGILFIGWLVAGRAGDFGGYAAAGLAYAHPLGLVATHVGLAGTAVVTVILAARVGRISPRWLLSVAGRVRGRWFLVCSALAVLVLGVVVALSGLMTAAPAAGVAWGAVAIIVLTSPLQAAAEELLFRGLLPQACGLLVRNAWFPIVGPALVFALLHGAQDVWLFANRFAFGVLMGVVVALTGGLEAAIAAHAVNNVLALGAAAWSGTLVQARTATVLAPLDALSGLAGYAVFAVFAVLIARRAGVATRTPAARG